MNAKEFSENLLLLQPNFDLVFNRYKSLEHTNLIRSNFNISMINDFELSKNPILDLISNFDLKTFALDSIVFDRLEEVDDLIIFGCSRYDFLSINSQNAYIEEYSHEGEGLTGSICAISQSSFLDALLVYAEFISKRVVGELSVSDENRINSYVEKCVSLSGTKKSIQFYKELML